jgi:hypothetical protein
MSNCWGHRYLCGSCLIKGKYAISASQNFFFKKCFKFKFVSHFLSNAASLLSRIQIFEQFCSLVHRSIIKTSSVNIVYKCICVGRRLLVVTPAEFRVALQLHSANFIKTKHSGLIFIVCSLLCVMICDSLSFNTTNISKQTNLIVYIGFI